MLATELDPLLEIEAEIEPLLTLDPFDDGQTTSQTTQSSGEYPFEPLLDPFEPLLDPLLELELDPLLELELEPDPLLELELEPDPLLELELDPLLILELDPVLELKASPLLDPGQVQSQ